MHTQMFPAVAVAPGRRAETGVGIGVFFCKDRGVQLRSAVVFFVSLQQHGEMVFLQLRYTF